MSVLITIVSGFASGVFLRSLFFTSWWPVVFALMLAVLVGAFAVVRPRMVYTLGAVFCLALALGAGRMALGEHKLPQVFASELKHRVQYEGVVVADPDVRDKNQRVQVEVEKGGEKTVMLAVAPRHPEVAVGDKVFVSGALDTPKVFETEGGRTFRYDKYLERDGVYFILNFAYLRVEEPAPWYSLSANLAKIKHLFINGIATTLPEPHASLASGIVIGGKSGLGTEIKDEFIRSGLVQIIVLSGYNVMVVAEWIIIALGLTSLPKRWATGAGALALLVFVGIAGFSATAIRAMVMALIALYARATGRTYVAGRALFFVVLLMLIYNPLYLVYDPGFGLSVVATAGLIWLAPIIEAWLSTKAKGGGARGRNIFESYLPSAVSPLGETERSQKVSSSSEHTPSEHTSNFWTTAIATTLSAQVAVLPLLLYETGNLSLVSVPANLLVMPIVPLAMSFSVLAGFAGIVFGSLLPLFGIVLALPAYLSTAYLLFIAHESSILPLAAFTIPSFSFWLVLAAYGALIYIASAKRFSITDQFTFAKKASM